MHQPADALFDIFVKSSFRGSGPGSRLARLTAHELTDEAKALLAELGYDPTYGARPLKRVIQKRLVDKLALAILEGEFGDGDGDTVAVGAADGELTLVKAAARAKATKKSNAAKAAA